MHSTSPFLKAGPFCLIFLFVSFGGLFAQRTSSFMYVPIELANNEVTSILQDQHGFLWIGTRGGLQWFDGHDTKLLKNDPGKGTNLLSQSIEVLTTGQHSNIWIGTKSGGLSHYDLKTGKLLNFRNPRRIADGFNADYILSMLDTKGDRLFIGTWKGFQYFNKRTQQFTVINATWKTFDILPDGSGGYWLATNGGLKHVNGALENDASYDFGMPGINIASIVVDTARHCLWLGTWKQGLIRFDPDTKTTRLFHYDKLDPGSLSSNNTYRVFMDSKGTLWVGTWGGGLNRYLEATGTFEKVPLITPGLYTNDNKIVLTIREDPSGLLWVGTDGSGVFQLDLHQKQFSNIGYTDRPGLFSGSTHVLSVFIDPFGKLWLGLKEAGIRYSDAQNKVHSLQFTAIDGSAETPFESRSFLQDGKYLWVASNNGLIRLENDRTGLGTRALFQPESYPGSIPGKKITVLAKDSAGMLWVGTQEHGLSRLTGYDRRGRPVFRNYLPAYGEKGALQNERISCLLVDSRKRLWVGTYKGLHLYEPELDGFRYFEKNDNAREGLSNHTILCLGEDRLGNIWAGTQYGLNRIRPMSDGDLDVSSFTRQNGLPSDYIHALTPDARGLIWVSTNKGIVRFHPEDQSFVAFDKRDGVQSTSFSENAFHRGDKGTVYFGGVEGVTYFNPDSIFISTFRPSIYFTGLRINNVPYEFGKDRTDNTILERPFYQTKSITLQHTENILTIAYAALDFHAPDKNEYAYLLEGFHRDWVFAGDNRSVTFTNLRPGSYRLKVRATNSDRIWNPEIHELTIRVLSPPWRTWWAYALYVAVFLLLLWLTRHLGLRQLALKNQLLLSRVELERELQLAEYKERLFTNISHEFRTPLTLILGPLDDLLQRRQHEPIVQKSLRLIQKQSRRMLRMVNQLLDFQKSESGQLKLSAEPGEIVSFCHDIFLIFQDEAQRKQIDYRFSSDVKYLSIAFDHHKLEIILFNILSNAFKFTPSGRSICLEVTRDGERGCIFRVIDTGRGIPPGDIDRIFDRFYRGWAEDATTISGTGIGLSFVKELAELHGGCIEVDSDGQSGSTFTVRLPGTRAIQPGYSAGADTLSPYLPKHEPEKTEYMHTETIPPFTEQEMPMILLIEDEPDMLEYVAEILAQSFEVITAVDGSEGLQKALELIPDLIVSDVMMPGIDGIELCRKLKADKATSHIPIILLTALSDLAHHVQGIREGADVYLPKPFHSQLLLVHIHNLIQSRNTLKELYARRIFLGSSNFEIKSFEEEFLFRLMKLVEENISNSQFHNDELASLMFMSRSTFYRKLKAVTGMSGNEFIRTTRLNHAAKLLESGSYSVTDAANEAGFNDIKYFRKRFQDQFGVSPSEHRR